MEENKKNESERTVQNIIVVNKQKSIGLAIVLAIFFGPLGQLYATVSGGLIMMLISVVVAIFTLGFGLFVTWPICVIWAAIAANNANKKAQSI